MSMILGGTEVNDCTPIIKVTDTIILSSEPFASYINYPFILYIHEKPYRDWSTIERQYYDGNGLSAPYFIEFTTKGIVYKEHLIEVDYNTNTLKYGEYIGNSYSVYSGIAIPLDYFQDGK